MSRKSTFLHKDIEPNRHNKQERGDQRERERERQRQRDRDPERDRHRERPILHFADVDQSVHSGYRSPEC